MKWTITAFLFAVLFLVPVSARADDGTDLRKLSGAEIAEMGNRAMIAKGLIAMGQKDGDAQYIAMGARILSELKAGVVDPATVKDGGKPGFFNPQALLDGIGGLKGAKEAAMSVKLSPDQTQRTGNVCYWNYKCDLFFCGQYWDCGY